MNRKEMITILRDSGCGFSDIAKLLAVSRQRIFQICNPERVYRCDVCNERNAKVKFGKIILCKKCVYDIAEKHEEIINK